MYEKWEIKGKVLDENSQPKKSLVVEAYHEELVTISLVPLLRVPLFYFLGRSGDTDNNGNFSIEFPNTAHGIFGFGDYPWPQLRIIDKNRIVHVHPTSIFIPGIIDNFEIKIPYPYSDKIDHVDWEELIENFLDKKIQDVREIIPQFEFPIESSKYLTPYWISRLDYRGRIVPERPKKQNHQPHRIPWNGSWNEDYAA